MSYLGTLQRDPSPGSLLCSHINLVEDEEPGSLKRQVRLLSFDGRSFHVTSDQLMSTGQVKISDLATVIEDPYLTALLRCLHRKGV